MKIGRLDLNSQQRLIIYDTDFESPTLQAAMGAGGGNIPLIIDKAIRLGNIYGTDKQGGFAGNVWDKECLCPTLKTCGGAEPTTRRVQDMGNISPTLQAGENDLCKVTEYRIRKLTPKECWRLMGFSDEDFEKAEKVNSNTQLYKQAGNSIVVDVLVEIFRNLFIETENIPLKGQMKLEDLV